MLRRAVALISLAASALATTTVAVPSEAAPVASQAARGDRVLSRQVTFDVSNTNRTSTVCLPDADRREHVVRARLIGPAHVVRGRAGVETFHVLVHDAGTGGWFWTLQGRGVSDQQNYAAQLARRGETVVVLDRLGYDRSPLRNGDATCLGAQASMLSQVVQSLYAGTYTVRGTRADASPPRASHVVLHGHGTGATVARLEAATYDDVQALVLMSPVTGNPSALALQTLRDQGLTCLRGASFAPYGGTDRAFRQLLFASATPTVQRLATRLRNSTPCGDVASLLSGVLAAQGQAVDVPTLVLQGSADARRGGDGITATSRTRLVRRTFAGAGSALPLERQAPAVRRTVLRFVGSLDDRRF